LVIKLAGLRTVVGAIAGVVLIGATAVVSRKAVTIPRVFVCPWSRAKTATDVTGDVADRPSSTVDATAERDGKNGGKQQNDFADDWPKVSFHIHIIAQID